MNYLQGSVASAKRETRVLTTAQTRRKNANLYKEGRAVVRTKEIKIGEIKRNTDKK